MKVNIPVPNFHKDDILNALGWGPPPSHVAADIASSLAIFGAGLMVGAGLGLLFAPRTGTETRTQLASKAGELGTQARELGTDLVNRLPFTHQDQAQGGRTLETSGAPAAGTGSTYHS